MGGEGNYTNGSSLSLGFINSLVDVTPGRDKEQ